MIEWSRIERWDYVVDSVASEYHRKFEIDFEDIKQSLYQWFIEHPNKLNEWEAIGDKDAKNLIYRSLRNQALDYCQHWKAKSGGYETSDLFYYESDMVEALLPSVLRGDFNITAQLNLASLLGLYVSIQIRLYLHPLSGARCFGPLGPTIFRSSR